MASKHEKINMLIEYMKDEPRSIIALSNFLNVSERTIFRYLLDIEKGKTGLVKLNDGSKEILYSVMDERLQLVPPSMISTLSQIRRDLVRTGNHKYHQALDTIIEVLDPQNKSDLTPKRKAINSDPSCYINHGPFAENARNEPKPVAKALQAIEERRVIKLIYIHGTNELPIDSLDDEESEEFSFNPYYVVLRIGRLYLLGAREEDPNKIVPYPFSRIKRLKVTSKKYPPNKFDPEEYYKYCVGQWVPIPKPLKPDKIVLEVKKEWVIRQFRESHFDKDVKIINSRVGYPKMELYLYITPDLENMVMQYMPHVRVLSPKKLVNSIQERLKQASRFQNQIK